MSTIVALSSSTGGAIAMVRLSGPNALSIIEKIFSKKLTPRMAVFGEISNEQLEVVDQVICTYFQNPNSYTGEDMVEISCHGSAWIASEIIRLVILGGASMASAGEFSKRAFLNGKLDLSQAEAVADLIASNSAAAASVAMRQMKGGYKIELSSVRAKLLHIKSMLELEMDFGDEDVEFTSRSALLLLLDEVITKITTLLDSFQNGNAIKNGISVAIVGAPNVGKSTLLNALVCDNRAIVSPEAGTTRDYIESHVTIDGILFRFIDTAGLRTTTQQIESEGIRRSREQAQNADIVLYVLSPGEDSSEIGSVENTRINSAEHQAENLVKKPCENISRNIIEGVSKNIAQNVAESFGENSAENLGEDSAKNFENMIVIHNKCDQYIPTTCNDGELYISAKSGEGLSELRSLLVSKSGAHRLASTQVLVSNARHAECLRLSLAAFIATRNEISSCMSSDMICSSLNIGLDHLAEITGEITTTDLLSNIFSKFCIGK